MQVFMQVLDLLPPITVSVIRLQQRQVHCPGLSLTMLLPGGEEQELQFVLWLPGFGFEWPAGSPEAQSGSRLPEPLHVPDTHQQSCSTITCIVLYIL